MKEKICEVCNEVYATHSYADELKPNTLCPGCTTAYLYEKYRKNSQNGTTIPVAPYYGISLKNGRKNQLHHINLSFPSVSLTG